MVSAVKICPRAAIGYSEEESEEEGVHSESSAMSIVQSEKSMDPIIQSESCTFPWNIDGELVEIANEVVIR